MPSGTVTTTEVTPHSTFLETTRDLEAPLALGRLLQKRTQRSGKSTFPRGRICTLPENDRDLSLWLVLEAVEDFEERAQKTVELANGFQRYTPEQEIMFDQMFGAMHSTTKDERDVRISIELFIMEGLKETSEEIMRKIIRFNPLFFATR